VLLHQHIICLVICATEWDTHADIVITPDITASQEDQGLNPMGLHLSPA
jgi:hypothetical protein